jgi:L-ascorbate metabolism protein UlaG (beta-lactamase superfamily)
MKIILQKLYSLIIIFTFLLFITGNGFAADSLKYIMHSFFKIKTSAGKVIYIDPAMVNSFEDSADVVLITHEHSDHNDLTRIKRKQNCIVIRSADALKNGVYQTFSIDNLTIKGVPAYNSHHSKSSCVGYVIEINGIKIYHAGDTGLIDEMADLANDNITFALLPMDGTYTMSPEQATEAAGRIKANYDIPIHTLPGTIGYSDQIVARFTSPNKMVIKPGAIIALSNPSSYLEGMKFQPGSFQLYQNYPNPFNPSTEIKYTISQPGYVKLSLFDITGDLIDTLVDDYSGPGNYKIVWNAEGLPSGAYFCRLEDGNNSITKKLLLIK